MIARANVSKLLEQLQSMPACQTFKALLHLLMYIVHQPPSSYLQNFVVFRRPLSEISAAKLRRFCCRPDPQKHTVDNYVSALHAATIM